MCTLHTFHVLGLCQEAQELQCIKLKLSSGPSWILEQHNGESTKSLKQSNMIITSICCPRPNKPKVQIFIFFCTFPFTLPYYHGAWCININIWCIHQELCVGSITFFSLSDSTLVMLGDAEERQHQKYTQLLYSTCKIIFGLVLD